LLYTLSMNVWNEILSKQFYLYSQCSTVCVGFFPWRDMVIMVILDGGCTGWALHIEENSRVELLTESAARDEWNQWVNERNYITNDTGTGMLRTSCYGLAVRWRNKQEDYARGSTLADAGRLDHNLDLNKMVREFCEKMITVNKTVSQDTKYPNYNYAMEA